MRPPTRSADTITVVAIAEGHEYARLEGESGSEVQFRAFSLPRISTLRGQAEWLLDLVNRDPQPRLALGHGRVGAALLESLAYVGPSLLDGVVVHAPLLHPLRALFGLPDRATLTWLASLPPIHMPAAVLWGERDPTFSTARLAALRRVLPAAMVSLPGRWGRRPMLDDPAAYAREVGALARKLLAR